MRGPSAGHTEKNKPFREVAVTVIAFVRTLILYLLLIVGLRLLGKRQVGELEPSELVVALVIADLAAVPMQDFGTPLLFGVIPILTLLALTLLASMLSLRSVRFRALLCGRPSILVENGVLCQRELARNRMTVDELTEELRMRGICDITTVRYAILETSGQLSVLPCAAQKPPTAQALGLSPEETGLPLILISDGRVLDHNLRLRGWDRARLDRELARHGASSPGEVYLLTADEQGRVYFAPKEAL